MFRQDNVKGQGKNELELKNIFEGLWDNGLIIVLIGIITAFIFILFTQLFISPEYESETSLFILSKQSQTSVNSSDIEFSESLTQDYIEIIQSRTVLERTISELNLNMSFEELLPEVLVVSPINTSIVSITVSTDDPYLSAEIADKIADISMEVIHQAVDAGTIYVLEPAEISTSSENPSLVKNGVIGGMAGCLISSLFIIWRILTNTVIRDSNDVRYYLGLETLGSIPLSNINHIKRTRKKHAEKNIT